MILNDDLIIELIRHPLSYDLALVWLEGETDLSEKVVDALIEEGIYESDPSLNGVYIEPCLQSLGVVQTSKKVMGYVLDGSDVEKMGALKLLYWVREDTSIGNEAEKKCEKNENAVKNNKEEYSWREQILTTEYLNCTNPVLKFYYQWALPNETESLLVNEPQTDSELYEIIKDDPDLLGLYDSLRIRKAEKEASVKFHSLSNFLLQLFKDSILSGTKLEITDEKLMFTSNRVNGYFKEVIKDSEKIITANDWDCLVNLPFVINHDIDDIKKIVDYLLKR